MKQKLLLSVILNNFLAPHVSLQFFPQQLWPTQMLTMIKTMVNYEFARNGDFILKTSDKRGKIVFAENFPVVPIGYMVYVLRNGSVNGNIKVEMCEDIQSLYVNGNKITVFNGHDLANIDSSSVGVEYVARSPGVVSITDRAFARTKERAKNEDIPVPPVVALMFCDKNQPYDAKAEIRLSAEMAAIIDRAFARTNKRDTDKNTSALSVVAPMFCHENQPFDAKTGTQLSETFAKLIPGFGNGMGYFNSAKITAVIIWTLCAIMKNGFDTG